MAKRTRNDAVREAVTDEELPRRTRASALKVLLQAAQTHPLRWHAVPHLLALLLLTGGSVLALAQVSPWEVAMVSGAISGLGLVVAKKKIPADMRGRAWLAGLTASTWLTLASMGISAELVAGLIVADAALPPWKQMRIGYDAPKPSKELVVRPTAEIVTPSYATEIPGLWAKNVGRAGKAAPGSFLVPESLETTEHTVSFIGQMEEGGQLLESLLFNLKRVASGLRLKSVSDIVIDNPPELGMELFKFRLQVVTNSPIKGTVYFDLPRYEDGAIYLGPYADGRGDARWRLYTEDSMWGGFILGGTGSGKTRALECIALTARSTMNTAIVYIDGQNGASSPLLNKYATWAGGTEDAQGMLNALIEAKNIRQAFNLEEGLTGFTPSREMPGILVIVDECHAIFPLDSEAWAALAREGRKVGIAIIGASQYNSLETFGKDPLRSSLLAGNCMVMRTLSNSAQGMMPGLMVNPASLPDIPGFAYTLASEEDGFGRTAPFRNRFSPDDKYIKKYGEIYTDGAKLPTIGEWFELIPDSPLDPITMHSMGDMFINRHDHAERRRLANKAKLDTLRAGLPPEVRAAQGGRFASGGVPAGVDANLPGLSSSSQPIPELKLNEMAVMDVVTASRASLMPSQIQAFMKDPQWGDKYNKGKGYGMAHIHNALKALVEYELLEKKKYGAYGLPGN